MPPTLKTGAVRAGGGGATPRAGAAPKASERGSTASSRASKRQDTGSVPAGGDAASKKPPADSAKRAPDKSGSPPGKNDSTPRAGAAAAGKGKEEKKAEAPSSAAAAMMAAASQSTQPVVLSVDVSAAIQAAAKAASDVCLAAGDSADKAQSVYIAVERAAIGILDPSGQAQLLETEEELPAVERIENTLSRALKANAIRVKDLFVDWDADSNGEISKQEFRKAMRALGLEGTKKDHDDLFDKWDTDKSGAIDMRELDKAIRKGIQALPDKASAGESAIDSSALLGRKKAGDIAKAKEDKAKSAFKAAERVLSPRSQQLKEAAEREEKQRREEEIERLRKEDEDGTTWTAAKWLASRGVSKVVAAAMQLPPRVAGDQSQYNHIKNMDKEKIAEVLGVAGLSGLTDFLCEAVGTLASQKTGSAEKLNDKFATTAKFQMTYGSLSLFYGGLESLLGPPKMYKGPQHEEKTLFNTMEFEHTAEKDSSVTFDNNSGVTTTPEMEWAVVTRPEKGFEYPEREGYKEHHTSWCRVPRSLESMLGDMEAMCNERLRKDGHSEMIREELVGGRLYTGPMYVKYNTVLRSKSKDPAMLQMVKQLTKGNGYPTTIHAINSCVIKLSKLTKAGKVWRGIKDATLPKEFWEPNAMGVRGGIEYAFSSTTVDKEQALLYAQGNSQKDGDASTIFEMQMGMVDRGADLTWLSQYPHEREVLLPPLTGIEALGTDVEGSMLVIHSRLSLNLAAHTLEQVLSRRRKMLLDMCEGIELEMRDALGAELVHVGIRLLKRALEYGPLSRDPEWFNDDENFAHVMQQTLYLQHGIVHEVARLNKDDPNLPLRGWTMGGPSRVLLVAGWVCSKGNSLQGDTSALLSIDLRDSKLNESEAEQLAELMYKQPRLTSLDLRNNETMGEKGAAALARFMEETCKASNVLHVPRSLLGVKPSTPSLEVPREIKPVELRLFCAEMASHIFSEGITAGMGNTKTKAATLNRRGASAASEWQPLIWAAKENYLPMVTMLLDLGHDVNQQQPNTTSLSAYSALHWAAVKGHEEMAKLLLDRGANKTLRDKHNNTALMHAEKKQNTSIVTMLGGDPNALKRGGD